MVYQDSKCRHIAQDCITLKQCKSICETFTEQNLTITYADTHSTWFIHNKKVQDSMQQIEILRKNQTYIYPLSKSDAATKIRKIITISKWKMPKNNYYNTKCIKV